MGLILDSVFLTVNSNNISGPSGSGGRDEGVVAEDRHEDERRQETHCRQQRQRDGARARGEARKVAASGFQVTLILTF